MGYDTDISLERKFTRILKAILGLQFIGQDPVHDKRNATDFEIFTVKPFTVGVRLRRYEYLQRFGSQFTIRWSRPSGVPTEIHKIRKGMVNYILYGFVSKDGQRIEQYFIGDLSVFREREPKPLEIRQNTSHDSMLAAFGISQFPPTFVVKQWKHP